jgi:DNA-binding IclR family transcriptional regulator
MQADEPRGVVVESVMRATRLLDCFGPGEPSLTLSEFVRRTGYPKTTTYRLLLTLSEAGWLERVEASAFRLTIRLFEIGSILIESLDLRQRSEAVMKRLSQQCGVNVHLVVPAGARAVCIERVDHAEEVRVLHLDVGTSQPLHQGGAPRALLAHDEAALLPELLRVGLGADTPMTLPNSPEELLDELAATRRRGYSFVDFGTDVGLAAVGAPVFDRSGRAIAGLGVCGLRDRVLPRRFHLTVSVQQAAGEVSVQLGGQAPFIPCRSGC